ncbi:MAG: MetS family NSS transporter small subunit [Cyclobacteriaceae bacterium]
MTFTSIVSMIICCGLVFGGFVFFLRLAIQHEKNVKENGED